MRWLNLLLILITFPAYLAPQVSPDTFSLFSFFGLLYPWLVLSNLIFIIYWGRKKHWYALYSIGCLLLGMNYLPTLFGTNFDEKELSNTTKIVSYNLYGLRGWDKESGWVYGNQLGEFKKQKAAFGAVKIFAGQEMSENLAEQIGEVFGLKKVTHHITNGIMTNLPVKDKGKIYFGKKTGNSCVWADVKMQKKTVRVYSVHLQSNKISGTASKIAKNGDLRERETWIDIKTIMGSYRQAAKIRAQQADKVAAHIAKCPHPVIICGDFNDTPISYTYRTLANNRKDSFCEEGLGLGTTYAGNIPAWRLAVMNGINLIFLTIMG
jgi:endonuclease/exonuclease/phosphatase family metal-dependent hydrolase